jgi:hypothetical protein
VVESRFTFSNGSTAIERVAAAVSLPGVDPESELLDRHGCQITRPAAAMRPAMSSAPGNARGLLEGLTVATGVDDTPMRIERSESRTAAALSGRRAGSFASSASTSSASRLGHAGSSFVTSGAGRESIAETMAATLGPEKGVCPVSSSNARTPSA